jgi:hypothetical protein
MPVWWGNNGFQWGWVMGFFQRAAGVAVVACVLAPVGHAWGQSNQTDAGRVRALVEIIQQRGQPTENGRYTCVQPAVDGSDTIVIDTDGSGVTQEVTRALSPTNTSQKYGTAVTLNPSPTGGGITRNVETLFSDGFPTETQNRILPFLAREKTDLENMSLSELLPVIGAYVDAVCPTINTRPAIAGIFPSYTR